MTYDHEEAGMSGKTMLSTPTDREIVTERVFDAPVDRVYAAFTSPELIPRWWGPRRMTTTVDEMDVKVGGRWRFVASDPGAPDQAFKGVYREIVPGERIVQTFEWEGSPGHVIAEMAEFETIGEGTLVRTTSLFHATEERDGMLASGMEGGLTESHDRLEELLAKEN
jgi:uncharacterized protein YndB with AHSA1/START domain